MENKKFSSEEAIKFGWKTLKENLRFFLIIGALILIVALIPGIGSDIYKKSNSATIKVISNVVSFFSQILSILIELGLVAITLKIFEKKEVKIHDLVSQYPLFFKYLLASILYSLIIFVGLFLFIIPGIIWGIKFQFFPYFIVEGEDIMDSLKKSSQITAGHKNDLFVFNLFLFLVALAGFLAFFVGILVAMPVASMATVFVYKKLRAEAKTLGKLNY